MKYYVKHMFSDHNKPIICFVLGCKMHRACQRRLNPCLLTNLLVYQLHITLLQFICKLSSERKNTTRILLEKDIESLNNAPLINCVRIGLAVIVCKTTY